MSESKNFIVVWKLPIEGVFGGDYLKSTAPQSTGWSILICLA